MDSIVKLLLALIIGYCNTQPCEDGYEATILPGTDHYVACDKKDG